MRIRRAGALSALLLAAGLAPGCALTRSGARLRFLPESEDGREVIVELFGIDPSVGSGQAGEDWTECFSLRVRAPETISDGALPPVVGSYHASGHALRFEPRFPLRPGLSYVAEFLPQRAGLPGDPLRATYSVPAIEQPPSTVVTQVFPTGALLPENLLKFYLHFSAPMSRGRSYEHIRLLDDTGVPVELPFLELDEELWDPRGVRLTVFIDPGRVKRGVRPLEEIGPALEAGRCYELVISPAWKDARGLPLAREWRRRFCVGPPDRRPPDPANWKLGIPGAATRSPLVVEFPEPLDHALLRRLVRVVDADGRPLEGSTRVGPGETSWEFTPPVAWPAGRFSLRVETTLEDLAGNSVGRPFEVDVFDGVDARIRPEIVTVAFRIE